MKKNLINIIKLNKKNSMLYQKTNEDFNNEKPNPLDPTQLKVHPLEEEKVVKFQEKQILNKKK